MGNQNSEEGEKNTPSKIQGEGKQTTGEKKNFEVISKSQSLIDHSSQKVENSEEEDLSSRLKEFIRDTIDPCPSEKIQNKGFVDINEKIYGIIFYYAGKLKIFKDLSIRRQDPPDDYYETIILDLKKDQVLRNLITKIRNDLEKKDKIVKIEEFSEYKDQIENRKAMNRKTIELCQTLAEEVFEFYGRNDLGIDIECEKRIKHLQHIRGRSTNLIYLGELEGCGLCRHRAILFKLLCDIFEIDCRILRGSVEFNSKRECHMWNEIVLTIRKEKENYLDESQKSKYHHDYVVDCMRPDLLKPVKKKGRSVGHSDFWTKYENLAHPLDFLDNDKDILRQVMEGYPKNREWSAFATGGNSAVYKLKMENMNLACKEITITNDPELFNNVLKEVSNMELLTHRNIVKVYGYFVHQKIINIIMQKHDMNAKTFAKEISKKKYGSLTADRRRLESLIFLIGAARGISHIHSFGFVHCDIKPENILVDFRNDKVTEARIADFGSCTIRKLNSSLTKQVPGFTYELAPPEIGKHKLCHTDSDEVKKYKADQLFRSTTKKVDIFCFGNVMVGFDGLFKDTPGFNNLSESCMKNNPNDRPTIKEVIGDLNKILKDLMTKYEERSVARDSFREGIERFRDEGDYRESLEYFKHCWSRFSYFSKPSEEIKEDPEKNNDLIFRSKVHFYLGRSYEELGYLDFALANYSKFKEIREYLKDEEGISDYFECLGRLCQKKGDYNDAREYFNTCLEMRKSIFGVDHPEVGICFANIANLDQEEEKFEDAKRNYNTSMVILEKKQEDGLLKDRVDRWISDVYNNYGNLLGDYQKYEDALKYLNISLQIRIDKLSNHPDIAQSYQNRGIIYDNMNMKSEALDDFKNCLKILESKLSPYNNNNKKKLSPIQKNIIKICLYCGDICEFPLDNSKRDLDQALKYYKKGNHGDDVKRVEEKLLKMEEKKKKI